MRTAIIVHFFRKEAHLSEEDVSLYVDALKLGRVDQLPPLFVEHAKNCPECQGEITGLFSLLAEEDYSKTGLHPFFDSPAGPVQREPLPILKIAAMLAAAVGIGIMMYWLFLRAPGDDHRTQPVAVSTGIDTNSARPQAGATPAIPTVRQEQIAERFTTSPALEDLMRSSVRSAETEVQSPAIGGAVHAGSIFRWTTSAQPPFDLTILDNGGSPVRTYKLHSSMYKLKDSLQAGLYYWKLVGEETLLHVGKFVVR
jgi:hypothetical protein